MNLNLINKLSISCLILFILLQSRGLGDFDVISQVAIGSRTINGQDLAASYPVFARIQANPGSLAQIIFAMAHNLAGWEGLRILNSLLLSFGFLLVVRAFGSRPASLSLLLAELISIILLLPNFWVRPQTFAVLGFSALIYASARTIKLSYFYLLYFLILVVWQNCHPSVILSLPILIWHLRNVTGIFNKFLALLPGLALCLLAQICTPLGTDIFSISSSNLHISRDILGITEWFVPWHPGIVQVMLPFMFYSFVLSIWLILNHSKFNKEYLLAYFMLISLSLFATRFALYYSLFSLFALYGMIQDVLSRFDKEIIRTLHRVFAICLVPLVLIFKPLAALPEQVSFALISSANFMISQPAKANQPVRVFNCRDLAGSLLFNSDQNLSLYYDGRLYLYTDSDWQFYTDASNGSLNLSVLQQKAPADFYVLCKDSQQKLIQQLLEQKMQLVYQDDYTSIIKDR